MVRDRRLGLLRYTFMIGIFSFIVVYQIFYNGSHLVQAHPEGTVQFTLMQPMDRCNDTERHNPHADCGLCYYKGKITQGTHDGWYSEDCYNAVPPVNTLPYCSQSPLPYPYFSANHSGKKPCDLRDFLDTQVIFESSILVTTRVTYSTQNKLCSTLDPNTTQCDRTWSIPGNNLPEYVAGVEGYTLMFDHSMELPQFDIRTYSSQMICRGLHMPKLLPDSDYYCQLYSNRSAPCMIMPNMTNTGASSGEGSDFFRVDILAAAAGIRLDDISFDNETYRYTGVTLTVTVQYYNRLNWRLKPGAAEYDYTVETIPHADYKLNTAVALTETKRAVYDRHGIRVVFVRAGTLHAFEFNQLLIQLTASLTLIALASLVVDMMCMYLLPYHAVYRSYKYIKTIDFSDLRDTVEERVIESGDDRSAVLKAIGAALEQAHDPFAGQLGEGNIRQLYSQPVSTLNWKASEGKGEADRLIRADDPLVIQGDTPVSSEKAPDEFGSFADSAAQTPEN